MEAIIGKVKYHHQIINGEGNSHNNNNHGGSEVNDYLQAVSEYRKTFASKQDVLDNTPDPAVREMLLHMEQIGCDTTFDRFDQQKPQCSFGLAGSCCRICYMGPCKITPKSPKGICGADADLIVARNILRGMAGGVAGHGIHAREVLLALKNAAEGKLNLPILGEDKVKKTAVQFGLETEGKTVNELASQIADILLEDLSRTVPGTFRAIEANAPEERKKVWKEMDIIPIGAYHEAFEALHRTGAATDGDWENVMKQFLRCGLAFVWSGVVGSAIGTDSLFGIGNRSTSKVNVGALKKGYVNIAVHGHLPVLVSEIVKQGRSEEFIKLAKENGAEGIQFYGVCCSGLSAMYRYNDVIPLSNAIGAELVLGTGALDLWVADVQDVYPSIMDVARCYKTTVVTTSDSARLPGAEHYGYDHQHSNIGETEALAKKIITRAIESFADRRDVPVFIPSYEVDAEIGFSLEYIQNRFGGVKPVLDAMKSGKILGIVNLVGCNNPRVVYEKTVVDIADILIKNNVLVLTNGCASFPLLKLGFCNTSALAKTGEGLRSFLESDLPPVWHMGECIDNARASGLFTTLAKEAGELIKDMPFALSSPEWSNEKGIGAALGFRLLGINSYHCVHAPVHGSEKVMNFLYTGTKDTLGSTMNVEVDHIKLAEMILQDLREKRVALGWDKE
ncbi:anaerobic carbon-monoxide dehydrogenase catalytic subunit [Clostridium cellulovorans]|uniref:anaerobic carbon-monoxide dehydrogenase n=1 Tax=Clostridium cellulovorans (strain ATCC 35296 / DSM 3052 / OCM 3 / 743B) TaxID=573061 RepID=D9SQ78_CLOC7|nr:anaerobic carbon-monoxide dehydrogenase catalytic subunit [Clostridium cellulovorans]ADL50145.1 carbon-monoxide dehydrogenase, catalytic subunit [Clostridium cellulovorans 743B]